MKTFLDANICLDLLDTSRVTAKNSVDWYIKNMGDSTRELFFSGDFITTFYYILTQKKKIPPKDVISAIDSLASEIEPVYIVHMDYISAKSSFFDGKFDDFEDLIILSSALRIGCEEFITNDKTVLKLRSFSNLKLTRPTA